MESTTSQFRLKHVLCAVVWLSLSFALWALAQRFRQEQGSIGFILACGALIFSMVAIGTLAHAMGMHLNLLFVKFRFWLLLLYAAYGAAWYACMISFTRTAPSRQVLGAAGYETAWKIIVGGGALIGSMLYFMNLWLARGLRRRAVRTVTK